MANKGAKFLPSVPIVQGKGAPNLEGLGARTPMSASTGSQSALGALPSRKPGAGGTALFQTQIASAFGGLPALPSGGGGADKDTFIRDKGAADLQKMIAGLFETSSSAPSAAARDSMAEQARRDQAYRDYVGKTGKRPTTFKELDELHQLGVRLFDSDSNTNVVKIGNFNKFVRNGINPRIALGLAFVPVELENDPHIIQALQAGDEVAMLRLIKSKQEGDPNILYDPAHGAYFFAPDDNIKDFLAPGN